MMRLRLLVSFLATLSLAMFALEGCWALVAAGAA
jgi:hypothetical protein